MSNADTTPEDLHIEEVSTEISDEETRQALLNNPVTRAMIERSQQETTEESEPFRSPKEVSEVDNTSDKVDWIAAVDKEIESVELTQEDKDSFCIAFGSGELWEASIHEGGIAPVYKFRARTAFEYDLMAMAVNQDMDNGEVKDVPSMVLRLQRYAAAVQLKSIGTKLLDAPLYDPDTKVEENLRALRAAVRAKVSRLPETSWFALRQALRLFDYKHRLMTDNIANTDFWQPAEKA